MSATYRYASTGLVHASLADGSDNSRQSFLIETKHDIELDRRGKRLVSRRGQYEAIDLGFLAGLKDDLVKTLQLALSTSLNHPNTSDTYTYFDGCYPGSYLYVETEKRIATWEFSFYWPEPEANRPCLGAYGILSDIKITSDAVHVEGYLDVSRDALYGGAQYPVGIDLTFSQGEVKGTLRIAVEKIPPSGFFRNWDWGWPDDLNRYRWTLEELDAAAKSILQWSIQVE